MTREEAISWLKKIKVKYVHGGDEDFDTKRKEALGMAIAALREQVNVVDSDQFNTNQRVSNTANALTNADHIRSMTDEELKAYLCYISDCSVCLWQSSNGCKLEDWLKQPYKEES